jgi:galactokinase
VTALDTEGYLSAFRQRFGGEPEVLVQAPGRVNLIGEHTDYHEGFVLPMAISKSLLLVARRRADREVRVFSRALDRDLAIQLGSQEREADADARYFQAVATVLRDRFPLEVGCDLLIDGDLPAGAGLSSSAALMVGFGALLADLHRVEIPPRELAVLSQQAEHWYGKQVGIMDQFVICHGRAGQALLLDCRDLSFEYVPLPPGVTIVIADTNSHHELIDSPYAERRRQAEAGLCCLRARLPEARTLRDVSLESLEQHRTDLLACDPSGLLWRRCRHVVTENLRTREAANALRGGDLATMGELMAASHASLRDDYEVSSPELDAMVEAAMAITGCLCARMTGGGFGGSTVNLVADAAVETFCPTLAASYLKQTGIQPTIFATTAHGGVQVVDLR